MKISNCKPLKTRKTSPEDQGTSIAWTDFPKKEGEGPNFLVDHAQDL